MTASMFLKIMRFYVRFTPSFTRLGYFARRPFWQDDNRNYSEQRWLVTGASGGIGEAIVSGAVNCGATVTAVARDSKKLALLTDASPRYVHSIVTDLSLQTEVELLAKKLISDGKKIDVLVNNVGILNDKCIVTAEGHEVTFALNVLNQYLLTKRLLEAGMLAKNCVVIMMASAGMYNVPLIPTMMNRTDSTSYRGTAAYGFHKRGQAALVAYWQEQAGPDGRSFYLMHPGWADTDGVKRSLPRFRKILQSILRNAEQGADTALWLAAARPKADYPASFWFDRKPRKAHVYSNTKVPACSEKEFVDFLESELSKGRNN
jgi:dehydrogenase/reductase SDR family protein 12